MNELSLFNFETSEIRVVMDEENVPLFVAKDVAVALGYANTNEAITKFCDGVAKRYPMLDKLNRKQKMRVIYEPDVYRLIFGSKLASAKKFQDWVFQEVLPAIRKTGEYKKTINEQQQRLIQEAVNRKVYRENSKHQTVYHELKTIFKIPKYNKLPASKFDECMKWLGTGYQVEVFNKERMEAIEVSAISLISHMNYVYSWFQAVKEPLQALNPKLVGEATGHFNDGRFSAIALEQKMNLYCDNSSAISKKWSVGDNIKIGY